MIVYILRRLGATFIVMAVVALVVSIERDTRAPWVAIVPKSTCVSDASLACP